MSLPLAEMPAIFTLLQDLYRVLLLHHCLLFKGQNRRRCWVLAVPRTLSSFLPVDGTLPSSWTPSKRFWTGFYFLFFIFYFVDSQNNDTSPAVKSLLSLMSPCAFSLGTSILNFAEQTHGINWSNISDAEVSKVRCSLLHVPPLHAAKVVVHRSTTPLAAFS